MPSALSELVQQGLDRYPTVPFRTEDGVFIVASPGPGGFAVSIGPHGPGAVVYWDRWHAEFSDLEEAVQFFLAGLSDEARLTVRSRGGFDYRWVAEGRRGSEWLPISETGLFLFPFWRRAEARVLQNRWISRGL